MKGFVYICLCIMLCLFFQPLYTLDKTELKKDLKKFFNDVGEAASEAAEKVQQAAEELVKEDPTTETAQTKAAPFAGNWRTQILKEVYDVIISSDGRMRLEYKGKPENVSLIGTWSADSKAIYFKVSQRTKSRLLTETITSMDETWTIMYTYKNDILYLSCPDFPANSSTVSAADNTAYIRR